MVETTMICLGEGHDKLVRSLITRQYFDAGLRKSTGVHHRDKLI